MTQKMWVRKDRMWWEVGCQCCGHLVGGDFSWDYAMVSARGHAGLHRFWDSLRD